MDKETLSQVKENTEVLEETQKTLSQIERINKLIDVWVGEK